MTNNIDLVEAPDESLWQTIKGDFAGVAGLKIVAVTALLLWMAFQWGFGNDALLPSIVAFTFDSVDDRSSWAVGAAGVAAAMAAGFLFWAITQLIDAIVMLSGLRLLPGISQRISAFLRRRGWITPYADMKWSTRWIIAYATGVSALCLVDAFATGTPGVRVRRRMIGVATVLSAGSVSLVVGLVTALAVIANRVPATEQGAETAIRFAKNPLTWILIFATVFAVGHLRSNRSET